MRVVLKGVINLLSVVLKSAKINKIISINNWMLSTNLYPDWDGEDVPGLTHYITHCFPDHVILFRSLNEVTNSILIHQLKAAGYIRMPVRQVYLFQQSENYIKKKNTKVDLKLLDRSNYEIVSHQDITSVDYERIAELYALLYLDKYSIHNPHFTKDLIQLWHEQGALVMMGLRNEVGVLDGIVGCFERAGVTSAPLVGYDTGLPQSLGLYRMLIALVMRRADDNSMLLNLSSGAAEFKRLRGGEPQIEYAYVYCKNLSYYRRFVWCFIAKLFDSIAVTILKKYKL